MNKFLLANGESLIMKKESSKNVTWRQLFLFVDEVISDFDFLSDNESDSELSIHFVKKNKKYQTFGVIFRTLFGLPLSLKDESGNTLCGLIISDVYRPGSSSFFSSYVRLKLLLSDEVLDTPVILIRNYELINGLSYNNSDIWTVAGDDDASTIFSDFRDKVKFNKSNIFMLSDITYSKKYEAPQVGITSMNSSGFPFFDDPDMLFEVKLNIDLENRLRTHYSNGVLTISKDINFVPREKKKPVRNKKSAKKSSRGRRR